MNQSEVSLIVEKIKKTMMDFIVDVSGQLKELVECKGGREEKTKKNATKKKEKQAMPPHLYYRKIFYPKLKEKLGDNKEVINELIKKKWNELTPEQKNLWKEKANEYKAKQDRNEDKKTQDTKPTSVVKPEVELLFQQENQDPKEESSAGEEDNSQNSASQDQEGSEADSMEQDYANYNFARKMDPFSKEDPQFLKEIEQRKLQKEEAKSKGIKVEASPSEVKTELVSSPSLLKARKAEESSVEPSTEKKKKKKKKKHKE